MKKAKIMLLSLAVVAVVGGALAFKAKNYAVEYCYTTATTSNPNAPKHSCTLITFSSTDPSATNKFFWATTKGVQDCNEILCPPLSLKGQPIN